MLCCSFEGIASRKLQGVAHKPSYDFLNRIEDTSLRVQKKVLFRTHEIPEGPLHPPTEGPSSTNCYHPWADNTYSTFLAQSRTGITDPKSNSFRPKEKDGNDGKELSSRRMLSSGSICLRDVISWVRHSPYRFIHSGTIPLVSKSNSFYIKPFQGYQWSKLSLQIYVSITMMERKKLLVAQIDRSYKRGNEPLTTEKRGKAAWKAESDSVSLPGLMFFLLSERRDLCNTPIYEPATSPSGGESSLIFWPVLYASSPNE